MRDNQSYMKGKIEIPNQYRLTPLTLKLKEEEEKAMKDKYSKLVLNKGERYSDRDKDSDFGKNVLSENEDDEEDYSNDAFSDNND